MAKGKKIETTVMVTKTGTSCIGMMAWETPYVRFLTPINGEVVWHSDNAQGAHYALTEGQIVKIRAFLYGDHLRRVTVTANNKIYGVGGI